MSDFKGTKRKWSYEYDGYGMRFNEIPCFIDDVYETYKEDALLISKAPEMLDMLENLRKFGANHGMPSDLYEELDKLIKEATEI